MWNFKRKNQSEYIKKLESQLKRKDLEIYAFRQVLNRIVHIIDRLRSEGALCVDQNQMDPVLYYSVKDAVDNDDDATILSLVKQHLGRRG